MGKSLPQAMPDRRGLSSFRVEDWCATGNSESAQDSNGSLIEA